MGRVIVEPPPTDRPTPAGWRARAWGLLASLGTRSGLVSLSLRAFPRSDLRILTYHNLASPPFLEEVAGIPDIRDLFRAQMAFLARHMSPVGEAELLAWTEEGGALPPNPVMITFDDGYRDTLDVALPVLQRLGMPAIVFVTAGCVGTERSIWPNRLYHWFHRTRKTELRDDLAPSTGEGVTLPLATAAQRRWAALVMLGRFKRLPAADRRPAMEDLARRLGVPAETDPHRALPMLSWEELRELDAGGVKVASHGVNHEILTRLTEQELRDELIRSKEMLEAGLGRSILGFAYPNGQPGDYDERTERALAEVGYRYGMVFHPGRPRVDRALALPRLAATQPNLAEFALELSPLGGRRGLASDRE